jgi:PAS domain S-box-containing protein
MISSKIRVLLIEGNPDDARVVQEMLSDTENLAFQVEVAEQASDGVLLIQRRKSTSDFDIILFSVSLRDSSGLNSLHAIQHHAPQTPVIVLTGPDGQATGRPAIQNGAQDHLVKGALEPPALMRAIAYAMERKRMAVEAHDDNAGFKTVFDAASDPMAVVTEKATIVYVNAAMAAKTGYDAAELENADISLIMTGTSDIALFSPDSSRSGNPARKTATELKTKNQGTISAECSISPFPAKSPKSNVLFAVFHLVADDIAEKQRLEKEYDREKDRFNKISTELEIAKEIQQNLYPQEIEPVDGLSITAAIIQAEQVGGDYYDIFHINDHEIVFVIADVAGHDVAAAFIVGMAKMSFQSHVLVHYESPEKLFQQVNSDLQKVIVVGRFLSAFCLYINTHSKIMRYVSAGHPQQCHYHYADNSHDLLHTDGFFIGLTEDGDYHEKTCRIATGDKIVLFTDGLFEIRSSENEFYGIERLHDHIRAIGATNAAAIHSALMSEQKTFSEGARLEDDTCVIVIEVGACGYEQMALDIFGVSPISHPPFNLTTKAAASKSIAAILATFDEARYPDTLIRNIKNLLETITATFSAKEVGNSTNFKALLHYEADRFMLALVLESQAGLIAGLFKNSEYSSILLHFSSLFTTFQINETGDRIVIMNDITETSLQKLIVDELAGGVYITVAPNIDPQYSAPLFFSELIQKGVINVDLHSIEEAFSAKNGQRVRIAPPFSYYDLKKEAFYTLTHHSLEAKIRLHPDNSAENNLTYEDLKYILVKNDIRFGIQTAVLQNLVANPLSDQENTVALGKEPIDGLDDEIQEKVAIYCSAAPYLKEDDMVDFAEIEKVSIVAKDDCIAELIPGTTGELGMSIYGRVVDFKRGKTLQLGSGKYTEISHAGNRLSALESGYAYRTAGGVNIQMVKKISPVAGQSYHEDAADQETFFTGDLQSSSIESAGNIYIFGNCTDCTLISHRGSLCCRGTLASSHPEKVIAADAIFADLILHGNISCKGTLSFRSGLVDTVADVGGDIRGVQGTQSYIRGGSTICRGSLYIDEIGDADGVVTHITMVGVPDPAIEKKLLKAKRDLAQCERDLFAVKETISSIDPLYNRDEPLTAFETNDLNVMLTNYFLQQDQYDQLTEIVNNYMQTQTKHIRYGTIIVGATVHPGVKISFDKVQKEITSETGPTVIFMVDNVICTMPLGHKS